MALMKYPRGADTALTANFRQSEFDCRGEIAANGGCEFTLVETKLVRKLQILRNKLGKSIVISSGYRCAAHNKAVGGASGSYHTRGYAADIYIRDRSISPQQLAAAAQSVGFTGIGLYDSSAGNFVHVDVRPKPYFWKTTSKCTVSLSGHGGKKPACPYKPGSSALRRGSVGNSVRAAQWMLNFAGYPCAVDGKFGAKTEAAVKAAQADMLLECDGIIGKNTGAMLSEVSA